MQRSAHKKRNPWKVAFLTLVTILVLVWGIPTLFFRNSVRNTQGTTSTATVQDQSFVDITLTKEMVQTILDQVSQQMNTQTQSPVSFTVNDSVIQMNGQTTVLGLTLPFTLSTVPYVTEDGNVQLKIESIQLSGINVPIGTVLNAFGQQENLPSWFELNQQEQYFTLKLSEIQPGNTILAKKIDLKSNEFVFSVSISNENIVKYLQ